MTWAQKLFGSVVAISLLIAGYGTFLNYQKNQIMYKHESNTFALYEANRLAQLLRLGDRGIARQCALASYRHYGTFSCQAIGFGATLSSVKVWYYGNRKKAEGEPLAVARIDLVGGKPAKVTIY